MPQGLSAERDRFLSLFDRLVESTDTWVEVTPADKLDWVPIRQPSVRFGERLSEVTSRNLYIHTIVGEHCWARSLAACDDGATIKPPLDMDLSAELADDDDLVGRARALHKENMALFASYSEEQLGKSIMFNGRSWTVAGLLWGIYAHRAFHLGNIDIHTRQAGVEPPDFFAFPGTVMA